METEEKVMSPDEWSETIKEAQKKLKKDLRRVERQYAEELKSRKREAARSEREVALVKAVREVKG